MSRRDDEPVFVGEFDEYEAAEAAWTVLTDSGIASAIVTSSPPWDREVHRVQVARKSANQALQALAGNDL